MTTDAGARATELLARMTLAEKAQQVTSVMSTVLVASGFDEQLMTSQLGQGIGQVALAPGTGGSAVDLARASNTIQRFLLERTRLGIPATLHGEALNGFVAPGFTSFPTAIALAATWDPDGVEEMADLVREQMRAVGFTQALSPVLDVARDARWGRVHETYGEDPYLASAMGVAFVRGLQGSDPATGVAATGKHFLGYAMTEAGQNMAATHLGPRELYDVYATPFEAAIRLAGLRSVMNSYSEVDGVPVAANPALLRTLLRDRMGFTGTVVADYASVQWLHTRQHVAGDLTGAGVLALAAGLDVELPNVRCYGPRLAEAVAAGRVDERLLDEAVLRVLTDKFASGLFDRPYVDEDPVALRSSAAQGQELSLALAERSVTLLKNDGVLPLAPSARVAVVGPHAASVMVGLAAYTFPAAVEMLQGVMTGETRMAGIDDMAEAPPELLGKVAESFVPLFTMDVEQLVRDDYHGSDLASALRAALGEGQVTCVPGIGLDPDDPQDLAAAVAAAEAADVVVLAIGGRAGWFGTKITEGESTDVARVELPDHQVALARAVAATGTPVVGVVHQGRTYALSAVDDLLSALLVAYFPGPRGAAAISSVLTGQVAPSGRLPYTMPRATGQLPIYHSQKPGSGYRRGEADLFRSYVDESVEPLYPFGHGLTYTTFAYGDLRLDRAEAPTDGGAVTATVRVTNTGDRAGREVVQLYASVEAHLVTRPALQLVGFASAELAPGQAVDVAFDLQTAQLGHSGADLRFVLEPGELVLGVGASSADLRSRAGLTLTGEVADLEGRRSFLCRTTVVDVPS